MSSPLLTLLRKVDAALDAHVDTPVWAMDEGELAEAMRLAHHIGNRLDETELRLASQAASRDVDVKTAWVRSTQQAPRVAAARLRLAAALETREPLRAAMARGEVSEAQALVVVRALDRLPVDRLSAEALEEAQAHMIGLCAHHHPDELRMLGRKLLEVIAPEVAEAEEARRVDAEYRRALATRRLELWDQCDGTYGIKGTLPAVHGHILDKLLRSWNAPKHRHALGILDDQTDQDGVRLDAAQRRARALCEFLERLNPHTVPYAGGVSARVVVDMTLDDLTHKLTDHGVVTVDGMVDLPAWEARRLACEAGLIPAVLGGKSEVLDLGRTRRFHNEPGRIAIHKRDKRCRAEGCDWPAWMSHIHHPVPWKDGGHTDMTGMSLCPHHHARAHDPTYEMRTTKNGKVVFIRR